MYLGSIKRHVVYVTCVTVKLPLLEIYFIIINFINLGHGRIKAWSIWFNIIVYKYRHVYNLIVYMHLEIKRTIHVGFSLS